MTFGEFSSKCENHKKGRKGEVGVWCYCSYYEPKHKTCNMENCPFR